MLVSSVLAPHWLTCQLKMNKFPIFFYINKSYIFFIFAIAMLSIAPKKKLLWASKALANYCQAVQSIPILDPFLQMPASICNKTSCKGTMSVPPSSPPPPFFFFLFFTGVLFWALHAFLHWASHCCNLAPLAYQQRENIVQKLQFGLSDPFGLVNYNCFVKG